MTPSAGERLHALCHGDKTGETLFHPILMHWAARHHGTTYSAFAQDYRVLVESNVRCLEDIGHDAVSVISDPFRETAALGGTIQFPVDDVPRCQAPIVRTMDDVAALRRPDVHTSPRTKDRIDGVRYYRQLLGDGIPVIGWIEGPLAEACDLGGVSDILFKLATDPNLCAALMAKCLVTAKDFAQAQIDAGSDVMGIGDAICSQISPATYERYVMPFHQELFQFVRERGALVKLHICGNITHLLPQLAHLPIDILDLDWMVDMGNAHAVMGPDVVICGNLNPVSIIQNLPATAVAKRAADLVTTERGQPFILSGGCEITVNTPLANLKAMRKATRSGKEQSWPNSS